MGLTELLLAWRHQPTHKKVWAFAIPMILSNLTVPLVGLVTTAAVGHLPHAYQLGAVAVGTSFYTVLASLSGSLRMGITGFAAQAQGQNDGAALKRICVQGVAIALLYTILLLLPAIPLANAVLGLMHASSELEALSRQFFQIRLLGLPAIMLQQALVGWSLGAQNARLPMVIMLTTNIFNIVLVVTLVSVLGWGIEGAAIASICAEWLGAFLGLYLIYNHSGKIKQKINWPSMRQWHNWRPLLQANRDIFIRTIALQAVFLSINLRSANLGDTIVAANAILLNGLLVCSYALDGLAHAVEALSGHAIGARHKLELRRTLIVAGTWALIISLIFTLGFFLFGDLFIALQTNIETVRQTAHNYLPYLAILPIIAIWSYLLDGLFIGATKAREMRNTMLVSVAIVLPIALLMAPLANHGLWLALLLFMLVRGILMAYVTSKWA